MALIFQLITSRQAEVTTQSLPGIKLVSEQTQQFMWELPNDNNLERQFKLWCVQKQALFTAADEAVAGSSLWLGSVIKGHAFLRDVDRSYQQQLIAVQRGNLRWKKKTPTITK